ncbi:MAG: Holliday junction branch migration protein RuvA [Pseudanabaenaceae cyanobacterium]
MIGYLRGAVVTLKPIESNRKTPVTMLLTLDVQGIGYDVQITAQQGALLATGKPDVQLFTHLQIRDDQMILFGFATAPERDLFRQLIAVSGVGPQVALTLLNSLGLADLLKAIVTGNTRVLSMAPGVGQKTAERLALELRSKLADWRGQQVNATNGKLTTGQDPLTAELEEELEMTLLALGYTAKEVRQALEAMMKIPVMRQSHDLETWLKGAITWLTDHG